MSCFINLSHTNDICFELICDSLYNGSGKGETMVLTMRFVTCRRSHNLSYHLNSSVIVVKKTNHRQTLDSAVIVLCFVQLPSILINVELRSLKDNIA